MFEKPSTHLTITADELKYIEKSKKESDYVFEKNFVKFKYFYKKIAINRNFFVFFVAFLFHRIDFDQTNDIPWKEIFKSRPVWAINVAQFAGKLIVKTFN